MEEWEESETPPHDIRMTKKIIDALSAISIAIYFAVAIYAVVWEESPRAPGHLSIESKIIVWNAVPCLFGSMWLLVRYAKTLQEGFQGVFGSWWKLALVVCAGAVAFFLHNIDFLHRLVAR
jgi:uncharacterized membrane protein